MRTSLFALVAARFFQAPSPASVPVTSPAVSDAVTYMAPMSYGFEQASFPSAPVVVPVAAPAATSSKALPLMAGAALGATVAVLFSSGKKGAAAKAKPAAKAVAKKPAAKAAAKKPVAKPAPKPVAKKPVAKAAPRPAPKKPAVKKGGFYNNTAGKGGIFPWIVNEKGSYSKPLMLSSIDFTSDEGDALVGWGAMPDSVKAIYNPKGRKGLFGGCTTPAKR